MKTTLMKGVIRNGRVEVEEPFNLPDGTELLISVQNGKSNDLDDACDSSPEGIADWLKWCDSLQPLKITAAEQADTDAWLKRINDYGSANAANGTEALFQ